MLRALMNEWCGGISAAFGFDYSTDWSKDSMVGVLGVAKEVALCGTVSVVGRHCGGGECIYTYIAFAVVCFDD